MGRNKITAVLERGSRNFKERSLATHGREGILGEMQVEIIHLNNFFRSTGLKTEPEPGRKKGR